MKWKVIQGDHYAYDNRGSNVAAVKRVSCGYYVISSTRGGFALDARGQIVWFRDVESGIAALDDPATSWGWAGHDYRQAKSVMPDEAGILAEI
jgi:hypothetical protein